MGGRLVKTASKCGWRLRPRRGICALRRSGRLVVASAWLALPAAAGRVSPRQATSLFAQPKREAKNLPCSQRPRKLRVANLSGQAAATANAGVRQNSLRAKALRSNSCRKSEHEVWLLCGSQTAGICCDRRRWLKGGGAAKHPTAGESSAACFRRRLHWPQFLAGRSLPLHPGEGGGEGQRRISLQ